MSQYKFKPYEVVSSIIRKANIAFQEVNNVIMAIYIFDNGYFDKECKFKIPSDKKEWYFHELVSCLCNELKN